MAFSVDENDTVEYSLFTRPSMPSLHCMVQFRLMNYWCGGEGRGVRPQEREQFGNRLGGPLG